MIRVGAPISGRGEGAVSVGAICSQIKITTRGRGRSAASSKVISNLRRIHLQLCKDHEEEQSNFVSFAECAFDKETIDTDS